jgi:hypothetical protein
VTLPGDSGRAVSDPIGLIVDLVAATAGELTPQQIAVVGGAVAGGRAKSRRLAAALSARPGILTDGRSTAPRVVGDLLLALRECCVSGWLLLVAGWIPGHVIGTIWRLDGVST